MRVAWSDWPGALHCLREGASVRKISNWIDVALGACLIIALIGLALVLGKQRATAPASGGRPVATAQPLARPTGTASPVPTAAPPYAAPTPVPLSTAKPSDTPVPEAPTATVAAATAAAAPNEPPPASQKLVQLTSPGKRGQKATLMVRTTPGFACTATLRYSPKSSDWQSLGTETAGADGICTWRWRVGYNIAPGDWSVDVTADGTTLTYPFIVQ